MATEEVAVQFHRCWVRVDIICFARSKHRASIINSKVAKDQAKLPQDRRGPCAFNHTWYTGEEFI